MPGSCEDKARSGCSSSGTFDWPDPYFKGYQVCRRALRMLGLYTCTYTCTFIRPQCRGCDKSTIDYTMAILQLGHLDSSAATSGLPPVSEPTRAETSDADAALSLGLRHVPAPKLPYPEYAPHVQQAAPGGKTAAQCRPDRAWALSASRSPCPSCGRLHGSPCRPTRT